WYISRHWYLALSMLRNYNNRGYVVFRHDELAYGLSVIQEWY
ncbi:21726_t:CDS:1, partial [Racocetra persica]